MDCQLEYGWTIKSVDTIEFLKNQWCIFIGCFWPSDGPDMFISPFFPVSMSVHSVSFCYFNNFFLLLFWTLLNKDLQVAGWLLNLRFLYKKLKKLLKYQKPTDNRFISPCWKYIYIWNWMWYSSIGTPGSQSLQQSFKYCICT